MIAELLFLVERSLSFCLSLSLFSPRSITTAVTDPEAVVLVRLTCYTGSSSHRASVSSALHVVLCLCMCLSCFFFTSVEKLSERLISPNVSSHTRNFTPIYSDTPSAQTHKHCTSPYFSTQKC